MGRQSDVAGAKSFPIPADPPPPQEPPFRHVVTPPNKRSLSKGKPCGERLLRDARVLWLAQRPPNP
eukprot:3008569-Pyramimonas_sp.AAC.1